jgi:hypothetical protein
MKKLHLVVLALGCFTMFGYGQGAAEEENKGFQKDRLFTGGSVSVSFSDNSFLIGVNPEFGYSLAKWADLGIVINYNYTSFRDYFILNDKLKQTIYGGGLFTRIFPVRFLFAQAQIEHNWIKLKYMPNNGNLNETQHLTGNSLLVGAGYTTGRNPEGGSVYGYLAVLFDVLREENSPYIQIVNNQKRSTPIVRAGVIIPLFQRSR